METNQIQIGKRALATSSDLATHLQVTTRTIQNWRKAGRIPFLRITARSLRYDIDQVERALAK
jgi:predicted site-specific integrase-resolvase